MLVADMLLSFKSPDPAMDVLSLVQVMLLPCMSPAPVMDTLR